jgi:hypothetical protein
MENEKSMKKDIFRQVAVILTISATIVINILANALPINGLGTGQISDQFKVYFVPAGYVFSIWGLIYIGLIAYAVFQALPAQRDNPRLRATGWWVSLGGLANIAWIFLWHYEKFVWTLAAMLLLLATLIITYLGMGIGRTRVSPGERYAAHLTFSIYLGWITVATIANVTDVLYYLNWDGLGLSPFIWMGVVLLAVFVIASLMSFTRRDVAYNAVVLWALAGIAIKFSGVPAVVIPTWITFFLVLLSLVAAFLLPSRTLSDAGSQPMEDKA